MIGKKSIDMILLDSKRLLGVGMYIQAAREYIDVLLMQKNTHQTI